MKVEKYKKGRIFRLLIILYPEGDRSWRSKKILQRSISGFVCYPKICSAKSKNDLREVKMAMYLSSGHEIKFTFSREDHNYNFKSFHVLLQN